MSGWTLACLDWEDRLRTGRSLVPELPLDHAAAARAVAIFDKLQLPDVPGYPRLAEAAGDWFRDIVRAAFGSWNAQTQERMIEEIFALVGKKNSKTTNCGALGLTWLLVNERPKASGIVVAPTQDIADIAYSQAEGMVLINPSLRARLRIQNHLKKITNVKTGATLEIFTFDPSVLTGQLPAFWILDELHQIAKNAKAASALGQLRGGMIAIPEAFGIIITTQSDSEPTGIFKTELAAARAIRNGQDTTSRTLPILYEFPDAIARDEDQWRDPQNWPMVMPNIGRSLTIDRMVKAFEKAKTKGKEEEIRWASQHLNIQVGLGLKTDHWPGARHWAKNADPSLSLAEIIRRCDLITVGVDGGGLDDILGLAVLGREVYEELVPAFPGPDVVVPQSRERWLHWGHGWLHRDVLALRKSEAPKFLELNSLGELDLVETMQDAFVQLADLVEDINEAGLLAKVGLDPVGVKLIVDELGRRGITADGGQVEGVMQGYRLMGTIKSVEDRLSDGTLRHANQALMSWSTGNCKVKVVSNSILVTKQASGTAKIDPVMALFDAAHLMLSSPEANGPSVYEERGFLVV